MERRRVVVTGMGILCPVGNNITEAWENTVAGKSGIDKITRWDPHEMEVQIAGEVKGFDPKQLFGHREARRMDRTTQLAMAAAAQAIEDSGLNLANEDPYEVGCVIGSGVGGIEVLLDQARQGWEKGIRTMSPLLVPMMLVDSPTGRVAIEYNLRGPNMAIATACATGNNTLGEATEMIRRGAAEVMIAGSTEAGIVPLSVAAFTNMGALCKHFDTPQTASRPFDKNRAGFVIAEGSGILILEELEHARKRGAKIYAEMLGYATTDDAYHVTAPMESGEGAFTAMKKALKNASLTTEDIDYINAHGTSTQLNDASETRAIKAMFGERAYDVPISSTKGVTGHILGAAGSVEAVFSIMAIQTGTIPPTAHLNTPDPECDLFYVPNQSIQRPVERVMSNSFGFGGHNAVLVMGKYHANGN
ncbi:MAG: beta-ketoacyl-ACP synthase II [Anaerolineae bacterium]|nr:beta-ketoacyl-ACP synthase II [Anaerolineae bacterium]